MAGVRGWRPAHSIPPSTATNRTFVPYDDHQRPHDDVTLPQLTLFIVWLVAVALWLVRSKRVVKWLYCYASRSIVPVQTETELPFIVTPNGPVTSAEPSSTSGDDGAAGSAPKSTEAASTESTAAVKTNFTSTIPPPNFDKFLQSAIILGFLMIYFYLCDYRKVFPIGEREYERDTFLFLVFMLFLVGCMCTLRPTNDKILNRDHTEEWKGWMQVMFVWYHYFAAKEWYNWIRIYIACYVWMTGFGNFSFFWVRKDFSAWRALKMLFRLDFLVAVICFTVSNSFMLYYICAMHTYWFISVYLMMGVLKSWNQHRVVMAFKFSVYAVANAIIFDVPSVAGTVFRPLTFLLGIANNPTDDLHEWLFRAGLDYWACFVGMLCAYNYPHWEAFILFLEGEFNSRRYHGVGRGDLVKLVVVAFLCIVFGIWHVGVLSMDKYSYNHWHPYTSWMPILAYILVRNMWPILRKYYVHLFAWLGKITLETYLAQLHIYLQSNAKHIIVYIPGYYLLNFSFATVIYLAISHRLFYITTDFSAFLIPTDRKLMLRNVLGVLVVVMVSLSVVVCIHYSGVRII